MAEVAAPWSDFYTVEAANSQTSTVSRATSKKKQPPLGRDEGLRLTPGGARARGDDAVGSRRVVDKLHAHPTPSTRFRSPGGSSGEPELLVWTAAAPRPSSPSPRTTRTA